MSVVFLTAAFAAQIGKSSTKSVLIAVADRADDKTGLAFPSVADIVERTELDRKTVLNCIAELQEKKILTDTGKRIGKTNQVKIWLLDFSLLKELSQKRDSSNPSESVPKTELSQKRNGSVFPPKASRFSAESVPKTGHGTTKEPSFNHHQEAVVDEIGDLVEAAVWAHKKEGGMVRNESGFRRSVRTRILSSGPNRDDAQNLLDWRATKRVNEKLSENRKQAVGRDHLLIDPVASKKGARLLSNEILAKIGMNEEGQAKPT